MAYHIYLHFVDLYISGNSIYHRLILWVFWNRESRTDSLDETPKFLLSETSGHCTWSPSRSIGKFGVWATV